MKTQILNFVNGAFLFLLLIFTGCDNDSGMIQQVDPVPLNYGACIENCETPGVQNSLQQPIPAINSREFTDCGFYSLLDFKIMHIPSDVASEVHGVEPAPEVSIQPFETRVSERIEITGEGGCWSDEFGRAFVNVQMRYSPEFNRIRGMFSLALFQDRSTLEIALSGSEPITEIPQFDGPHLALVMNTRLLSGTGQFENVQMQATAYLLDADNLLDPEITTFRAYLMITGEMDLPQ